MYPQAYPSPTLYRFQTYPLGSSYAMPSLAMPYAQPQHETAAPPSSPQPQINTPTIKAAATSTPSPAKSPTEQPNTLKTLGTAAGLIGLGLLLKRIPARASQFELISTRIEDWAKLGLGVIAVNKINEATNWKPAAWAHALETVSVLSVMSHGIPTPKNISRWKHFPLLATAVPALVQGTHWVTEKTNRYLDEQNSPIPKWIPKLLITGLSTVGGVLGLRQVMQSTAYQNLTAGSGSENIAEQVAGTEIIACSRCGGAHLVCMDEVGEFIGTMGGWVKSQFTPKKALSTEDTRYALHQSSH